MIELEGRPVLISGASSGLGARMARVAAAAGAKVIAGARRTEKLADLVAEIEAAGGQAMAVPLDVNDEASVEAAFDLAERRFGAVLGVVANAGINVEGRALDIDVGDFDRVFATNVRGVFLTTCTAARRLQKAGLAHDGRIVVISSITAKVQTSGTAVYSSSKAAVSHLARCLAKEWARKGPNVNIVSPGYIRTELTGDWFDSPGGARQIEGWPRRRLVEDDALDAILLYLLSADSRNVTGADFTVDDGQSL